MRVVRLRIIKWLVATSWIGIGLALFWPANVEAAQAASGVKVVYIQEGQTITVPLWTSVEDISRAEYTVTMVTVVQWPISAHSPISSGFGYRNAPCWWGCSSNHKGTDYTPGAGTSVYAIADGVVSSSHCDRGGLGCQVWIEHTINGQHVTSIYGHMQYGSLSVHAGQTIDRGTFLGRVGSTGTSTGNHLHFEIHVNGTPVDSNRWIHSHANNWMWE